MKYEFGCSPKYTGENELALANGRLGSSDNFRIQWVGFQDVDMFVTIELLKPTDITSIEARFLQNQGSWIFLPKGIEYKISSGGQNYTTIFSTSINSGIKSDATEVFSYPARCSHENIKYVRVKAVNIGECPAWHQGTGGKAWVFYDEIIIE